MTQNLRECSCGKPIGSRFWHGRAWWNWLRREVRCEWMFGSHARGAAATITFGGGDDDSGVMLHLCIPWLFSVYFGVAGFIHCEEAQTGIAIHNGGIWFYPLSYRMKSDSKDQWWRKVYCWYFPWQYDWYSTEILEHKANIPGLAETVWEESRRDRRNQIDPFTGMRTREASERANSETYDYTYRLKNGEVQHRKATVYVDRVTWRMRWWPLLPFKKKRTCINVQFDQEVGEGTGSWKGGCVGCGYEMKIGETPLETLRRMESERKFSR